MDDWRTRLVTSPADVSRIVRECRRIAVLIGMFWITGVLYDRTQSYAPAFWLGIGLSLTSAAAIWLAAPRKVRAMAGRTPRPAAPAARLAKSGA